MVWKACSWKKLIGKRSPAGHEENLGKWENDHYITMTEDEEQVVEVISSPQLEPCSDVTTGRVAAWASCGWVLWLECLGTAGGQLQGSVPAKFRAEALRGPFAAFDTALQATSTATHCPDLAPARDKHHRATQ